MISYARWFVVCLVLGVLAPSSARCRDWHRNDGKLVAQGKLLKIEDGRAIVLSDDGLTIGIPLEQLSLDDADYVKQLTPQKATVSEPSATRESKANNGRKPGVPAVRASTKGADGFPLSDPDITSWQTRPDPPKWNWSDLPDPLPIAQLPKFNPSDGFVMPRYPSPYLAIATSRGDYRIWDRWDLKTGQRDGAVRGAPRENGRPAMSADGKFLAMLPSRDADSVEVWSFDTGNRVGRVELVEKGYTQDSLAFVADRGLMMARNREVPAIFDWLSGKQRASLSRGYIFSDTRTALSPGEHYFAVYQQQSNRIGLLDTRNGAVAGDLLVPEMKDDYNACNALGFSSDGSRLWALVGKLRSYRLLAWNLADGSTVANLKLDTLASNGVQDTGRTDFIPDFLEVPRAHAILLKGSVLLDEKTGAVIWEHSSRANGDEPSILRIVGDSRMLVFHHSSGGTETIAIEPIPFDTMKASRDLIAKGGTAQDVGLPPLTQPDWKSVKRGQKIQGADIEYKPPASSVPAAFPDRTILAPDTTNGVPVLSPQFAFAGGDSPRCAMLYMINAQQPAQVRHDAAMLLDNYQLTDGALKGRMTLVKAVSLLDIGPDGSRAIVATTEDGRIDVWDFAGTKHVLGFRPTGLRDTQNLYMQSRSAGFPFAKLVGGGHLLTAHTSGELALWKIDGCEPSYSLQLVPASVVALDQSRTYVLAQDANGIHICSVDRGKSVKTLVATQLPADSILTAAAFRSNGEEVAMLLQVRSAMTFHLLIWNIEKDAITWDTSLPFVPRQLAWAGDDVLLGSLGPRGPYGMAYRHPYRQRTPNEPNYERQLPEAADEWTPELMGSIVRVSPTEQRFVWRYQGKQHAGPTGPVEYVYQGQLLQIVGQTAGDRTWLSFSPSATKVTLISLAGRTAQEDEAIRKSSTDKRIEVSGVKISVSVDVDSLPDTVPRAGQRRDEFRAAIESSLKKQLTGRTIAVSKDRPLALRAKLQQCRASDLLAPSGRAPLFSPGTPYYNLSPQGPNAAGILARVELRFKDQSDNDDPLWLNEAWFAFEGVLPASKDAQSNMQMLVPWERALDWLDKRTLPATVTDSNSFASVGTTELIPDEPRGIPQTATPDDSKETEGPAEQ